MPRIFRKFLVPLVAGALPHATLAQEVGDCDWRSQARNLVEPWQDNTRSFANGAVRLAVLDTIEPAAGAFHLLVISPPYAELGEAQCKVISLVGSVGFAAVSFDQLTAEYDPAVGLIFTLPVGRYATDTGTTTPTVLGFTLNQATGAIHAEVSP